MQLIHQLQWKSYRQFIVGSSGEIPHLLDIYNRFGVNNDMLDIDIMTYDTSHYAAHRSVTMPGMYDGSALRIYTDDVHYGYVRLIKEKDNTELRLSDLFTMDDDVVKHGPCVMIDRRMSILRNKYSLSNDAVDIAKSQMLQITCIDVVYAVHSPYWPVEATEWIKRRRPHGFPSKSVIKQVVKYGCDFVQVSHKRLSNDNEWRFSFSRAEQFIIKSWSTSQRIVYRSLWVLNKRIGSRTLCT